MSIIHLNYGNVHQQARKLRSAADEHRRAAAAVERSRGYVDGAWRDEAGATYAGAATRLINDMRKTAGDMDRVADDLVRIAAEYRGAAERLAQAAKSLQTGLGGSGGGGGR